MTRRFPRRWYDEGGQLPRLPHEVQPPDDHEHWFRWEHSERRSWTESTYIALAVCVAIVVALLAVFGLAPLLAVLP